MKALPLETVRLLSSSQVITCVLNVVKELIENSLDAGSTSLEVKLENYGLDRIEVRDNGCGIQAADVSAMALKHYTSKISCHEDLEHLDTYGFRGEALASICAISEVVVTTKSVDDDISTQYTLDVSGHIVSQRPSHLGQGTTVCVMKLFKNLPVRRHYYSSSKKCKEELKKVQDLLMAYAVIKPELRITLTHNKAVFWQKSRVSDHRSALAIVLGAASAANLLPFQHRQEQPQITIDGYFPKPHSDLISTSSSTSDKTFIYVNNRPVHHKDILKLVKQYYANAANANSDSASRRFPISMMNITVPASTVDVNLTPDKTQVLLENKDAVLLAVESVLISLYGSYSVGNDVQTPEAGQSCSGMAHQVLPIAESQTSPDEARVEGLAQSNQEYCMVPSSEILEHSITDIQPQASETSLPGTANTSSSSSSEDWIINKSLSDFDATANFSSFADNVVLNSTVDQGRSSKNDLTLAHVDEISSESWSAGTALRDPATGQCLQPVKLHFPEAQRDDQAVREPRSGGPQKRPCNIITAKTAKPTAYDLISSHAVRQPLSAFALFERDTRSSVLLENSRASLQDVTSAVKERWECLGEEERRKYEKKAQKSLESYNQQKAAASAGHAPGLADERPSTTRAQGVKRKAPLSNQQMLDRLFSSQPASRRTPPKQCRPLPFSIDALSVLGGGEYMDVLMSMDKSSPSISGEVLFTDPRLVANGFQIRLTPGFPPTGRCVEVTGITDCMPFYGIADLREILAAVKDRDGKTVQQCRPLKAANYLEGEAVRLARQLPLSLSREDVNNMLFRMKQELDEKQEVCLHGRPFFYDLIDVPETEQEALEIKTTTKSF